MELKKLKDADNSILVEVQGETQTVTNALREELWEDKSVTEAAQIKEHPYLAQPKILVKTDKGSPSAALVKASDRIVDKIKSLEEEFKKAMK
jgi:DNA-directed RNA polymerase subunit L